MERFLDAPGTKEAWLQALRGCKSAFLLAYTFDLEEIVEELIAARVKQSVVRLIVDKRTAGSGQTKRMKPALARLVSYGVQ
eukprot:950545-Alexandrium_andersonii.AAC.1